MEQIENQTWCQIWNQAERHLRSRVWRQIIEQIESPIGSLAYEQVMEDTDGAKSGARAKDAVPGQ
jgi:hypothetical protein